MSTLVASQFEDDASEILEFGYGPGVAYMFRARIHDGQRVGQAFMNTLFLVDPKEHDRIEASMIDPFYSDKNIPAALDLLTSK